MYLVGLRTRPNFHADIPFFAINCALLFSEMFNGTDADKNANGRSAVSPIVDPRNTLDCSL
jgi:hypothetical protein